MPGGYRSYRRTAGPLTGRGLAPVRAGRAEAEFAERAWGPVRLDDVPVEFEPQLEEPALGVVAFSYHTRQAPGQLARHLPGPG